MADEQHIAASPSSDAPSGADPAAAPAPPAPPTVPGVLGKPPRLPVWPNVIGVIGVIYAVGGILLSGWQVLSLVLFGSFSAMFQTSGPNPAEAMSGWSPWLAGTGLFGIALSILLLIGCFGLLTNRPRGRTLLLTWSVLRIFAAVVNAAIGILIGRDMMAEMAQQGGPAFPFMTSGVFLWISLIFNILFYSAFPVFLLIWLNLKGPKREVQRWREAGQGPPKVAAPAGAS